MYGYVIIQFNVLWKLCVWKVRLTHHYANYINVKQSYIFWFEIHYDDLFFGYLCSIKFWRAVTEAGSGNYSYSMSIYPE